jgi:predicted GIY-YIG superfamily endonuclease
MDRHQGEHLALLGHDRRRASQLQNRTPPCLETLSRQGVARRPGSRQRMSTAIRPDAVYVMFGHDDKPIYIGQSTDVRARLASHRRDRGHFPPLGNQTRWEATKRVEVIDCADRAEMCRTERALIAHYRPVLNKLDNPDDPYHEVQVQAWVQSVMRRWAAPVRRRGSTVANTMGDERANGTASLRHSIP